MPDRRTFLITCGGVVAAPAFAQFELPLTTGLPASLPVVPSKLVLRIDGWESPVDSESVAWVQINSSWRATWR